jgi:hypothetical protein
MNRNRVFLVLATVVLAALTVGFLLRERRASAADSLPALVALAPADARFLAYADISALRDSPLVQRLTAMAPPATADGDYAAFVAATGFDYQRDLDRVVIATRQNGGQASQQNGSSDQTVAFADGRFNREKIEQYALRSGKLTHEDGHAVYLIPSTTPGKTVSIAFLTNDRIALADGGDLSAAFSPSTVALDATMRDRLLRVAGAPLFAVVKTPTAGGGTQSSPVAGGFSASFQSLRWVSLAVRPDGGTLLLSAEGECDGPGQAQSVAAGLELLRGLVRNGLSDPKARGKMPAATAAAIDQMLGSAHVSADASRVRLLMTVTPEMLASAPGGAAPSGH